jgi:hypothetical protein
MSDPKSVVDLDPELFDQVGSGIIAKDQNLTFLAKNLYYNFCKFFFKMVQFVFEDFLRNFVEYMFLKSCRSPLYVGTF